MSSKKPTTSPKPASPKKQPGEFLRGDPQKKTEQSRYVMLTLKDSLPDSTATRKTEPDLVLIFGAGLLFGLALGWMLTRYDQGEP